MKHLSLLVFLLLAPLAVAAPLKAGVAKVEITDRSAGPVNDSSYVKALVLQSDDRTVVIVTVDVVAIGEIGRIGNGYLASVRAQLQKDLGIPPENVLINASHCHSIVRADADTLTVQAVKMAAKELVPVKVGAGTGQEDRISENRRLKMKDGSEVDMRRAYAMPRDEDIAGVGPIDPQIAVLRLDRVDGGPLAVLYEFACHPIMGMPGGGNTADYPGFASKVIEENIGHGALAFFIQGCAGDINPVRYKEVTEPHNAEILGNRLGLSVLQAVHQIESKENAPLRCSSEILVLPRGNDLEQRMAANQAEQVKLLSKLRPTNINFKAFLPLLLEQRMWPEFPSHHAQSYLHDRALGRDDLPQLDAANRAEVEAYLQNIQIMEELTRLTTNFALLKKHLAQTQAAGKPTIDVELAGVRIGDFKLVTFPGELTVEIGLNIKRAVGDPLAFVAGYTNGYIYYTPTAVQRRNTGYAQEDCDSLVAPEWQKLFEERAAAILKKLAAP
ncbi:MAG: hypothetical protein ABJF10_09095 [Chthoniobacter sp.]|uniref:hypothetical protein n=1 Tax=Chthoniobacter sp. TaxID=2510640 RepID=UPI0032A3F501